MPKGLTKYNVSWESEFPFLKPGPTEHEAHCLDLIIIFQSVMVEKVTLKNIYNKKCIRKTIENSSDLVECAENQVDENNNEANIREILTPQEEVIREETIQALKVVNSNYSFLSTTDDGDRFRSMFPDSNIAKQYHMSKTKVGYVIKHGIF
ncbi:unnamed protein product [Meganyctiphanes norvegica]|uniref:Uncharacterized protein n=1 Tax=Meganyctiphanes norvegica TaxID=48144 RepID=A0AAV2QN79_MEGNR